MCLQPYTYELLFGAKKECEFIIFTNFQELMFHKRRRNENPNQLRSTILRDKFLSYNYTRLLNRQLDLIKSSFDVSNLDNLIIYELGSAGGITNIFQPKIVTSDVRLSDGVQISIDACNLSLKSNSVDAFISKDMLHHLPNVTSHFSELCRVLRPGGMSLYIEPNWNLVSRIIFSLFHPEPWIPRAKTWLLESQDPMYSNQALPWILFVRDKEEFTQQFPELDFQVYEPMNSLYFILSGGAFKRNRVPSTFLIFLSRIEHKLKFTLYFFGVSRLILVRKRMEQ